MQVPVMIFVTYANTQGVDTRIKLDSGQSSFEDGYDRLVYISEQFPSTLLAFVRRAADGTEELLTSPAVKFACALKAGKNLPRGRAIVDVEAWVSFVRRPPTVASHAGRCPARDRRRAGRRDRRACSGLR